MPVGYLEHDWDPKLVFTMDRGKEFKFSFYRAENGVGICFYDKRAFGIYIDDDMAEPEDSIEMLKEVISEGYEADEYFDEGETMCTVMLNGAVLGGSADSLGLTESDMSTIKLFYSDIDKKYWS